VLATAVRHHALDRNAQRAEAVGQVARGQRGLHRGHTAADVDADRRRDDRADGRDHAADGRADPEVHVGHRRDPAVHERHAREVAELRDRLGLDRHAERPALDRHAALGLALLVVGGHRRRTRSRRLKHRAARRQSGAKLHEIDRARDES
jgi:hypothetical protein